RGSRERAPGPAPAGRAACAPWREPSPPRRRSARSEATSSGSWHSFKNLHQQVLIPVLDEIDPTLLVHQVENMDHERIPPLAIVEPGRSRCAGYDNGKYREAGGIAECER